MSPTDLYNGAVKFVTASAKLHPDKLNKVAQTQTDRVIQELGKMELDHDQATELMEKLAQDDDRDPFSAAQREAIGDVLQKVLDDDQTAAPVTRTINKEQANLTIYKYFPDKLWDLLRSQESLKTSSST